MDCLFNKSFEKTMKGFQNWCWGHPSSLPLKQVLPIGLKILFLKMNQKLFKFAIIFMSIQNWGTWVQHFKISAK